MKWLARSGYAARGLIYLTVGLLAMLASSGAGSPPGTEDALSALMSHWAGGVVAYTLAAGLLLHALWRLVQAALDTDRHGSGLQGAAIRAGLLASGITYLTLAVYAVSARRGAGSGDGGGFAESLAQLVGAQLSAALLAAVLAAVGIAHFAKAIGERYADHFVAGPSAMRFIHPVAKVGLMARGTVLLIVAMLFGLRAWRGGGTGTEDAGSREALEFVQSMPAGGALLAAVGGGLVAFAAYSFAEARYRRIDLGALRSRLA